MLVTPLAISRQNARCTSRRNDGRPGDFIAERPVNSCIHPAGLPINTPTIKVLRRPVESTLDTASQHTLIDVQRKLEGQLSMLRAQMAD